MKLDAIDHIGIIQRTCIYTAAFATHFSFSTILEKFGLSNFISGFGDARSQFVSHLRFFWRNGTGSAGIGTSSFNAASAAA